jgi:predicted chitinase
MLALLDMSPTTYRRPGIAALMANLEAEDSGLGNACSAEGLRYRGTAIRDNFTGSLQNYFCAPDGPGYTTGQRAEWVRADGRCDTSDAALERLRDAIVAENPASLTSLPAYRKETLGPIVIRIYRYRFAETSDTAAFRFRGRGFIQITGRQNYSHCQSDIARAAAYLQTNQEARQAARAVTRVDWSALNITANPEVVSENRFIAAFCAASYWSRMVAPTEMVLSVDAAQSHFKRVVRQINGSSEKATARLPLYNRWCDVANCRRNYPAALNMGAGFQAIVRFRRNGFSGS